MTNLVAIVLNVQMLTNKSISSGDLTYLDLRHVANEAINMEDLFCTKLR
jgi:hypothetical protein